MDAIDVDAMPLVNSEVAFLAEQQPLAGAQIIELGCGAAKFAREVLEREPETVFTCLEVDATQMALNRAQPAHPRLHWVEAGAQAIPFGDEQFDGAMMLKSLHHIPVALMDQALAEAARVLKPGGWLYVSEPIFGGPLNELVRLYNDEQVVRAQAQAALDRALQTGVWSSTLDHRFVVPMQFANFAEFAKRMMNATYRNDQIDSELLQRAAQVYAPHQGADGAHFRVPMHVRLLRKV